MGNQTSTSAVNAVAAADPDAADDAAADADLFSGSFSSNESQLSNDQCCLNETIEEFGINNHNFSDHFETYSLNECTLKSHVNNVKIALGYIVNEDGGTIQVSEELRAKLRELYDELGCFLKLPQDTVNVCDTTSENTCPFGKNMSTVDRSLSVDSFSCALNQAFIIKNNAECTDLNFGTPPPPADHCEIKAGVPNTAEFDADQSEQVACALPSKFYFDNADCTPIELSQVALQESQGEDCLDGGNVLQPLSLRHPITDIREENLSVDATEGVDKPASLGCEVACHSAVIDKSVVNKTQENADSLVRFPIDLQMILSNDESVATFGKAMIKNALSFEKYASSFKAALQDNKAAAEVGRALCRNALSFQFSQSAKADECSPSEKHINDLNSVYVVRSEKSTKTSLINRCVSNIQDDAFVFNRPIGKRDKENRMPKTRRSQKQTVRKESVVSFEGGQVFRVENALISDSSNLSSSDERQTRKYLRLTQDVVDSRKATEREGPKIAFSLQEDSEVGSIITSKSTVQSSVVHLKSKRIKNKVLEKLASKSITKALESRLQVKEVSKENVEFISEAQLQVNEKNATEWSNKGDANNKTVEEHMESLSNELAEKLSVSMCFSEESGSSLVDTESDCQEISDTVDTDDDGTIDLKTKDERISRWFGIYYFSDKYIFCSVCNMNIFSYLRVLDHVSGKTHTKNLLKQNLLGEPAERTAEELQYVWNQIELSLGKMLFSILVHFEGEQLSCNLCDIRVSGYLNAIDHVSRKKHQALFLLKLLSQVEGTSNPGEKTAQTSADDTLESSLDRSSTGSENMSGCIENDSLEADLSGIYYFAKNYVFCSHCNMNLFSSSNVLGHIRKMSHQAHVLKYKPMAVGVKPYKMETKVETIWNQIEQTLGQPLFNIILCISNDCNFFCDLCNTQVITPGHLNVLDHVSGRKHNTLLFNHIQEQLTG